MNYESYNDKQLLDGLLNNDEQLIEYFFLYKCEKLFVYIIFNVFDNAISKYELVGELYLYLAKDNWAVLRAFRFRSSLMTYVSVVSIRFFQKKRLELIDSLPKIALYDKMQFSHMENISADSRIDLHSAISRMPNARYRQVIEKLDLQGWKPDELAKEMGVTVDNLYNIHRRAIVQLRLVMGMN